MAAEEERLSRFWESLQAFLASKDTIALKEQLGKENLTDVLKKQCIDLASEQDDAKEYMISTLEHMISRLQPPGSDNGSGNSYHDGYLREAPNLLKLCSFILTNIFDSGNYENKEILSWRRTLIKKVTVQIVVMCACHMKPNSWTSEQTRAAAKDLLNTVCKCCQCGSITQLLSGSEGKDTSDHSVFMTGIMRHLLDTLQPFLTRDNWHTCPAMRHALVWCVMQTKYPNIGEHVTKLLPPLLLLLDDQEVDNQVMSVTCLHHVITNTNVAELSWYGRADVIYEALQRLIYTNEPELVIALHPCILSILKVLEPAPSKLDRKVTEASKYHSVFQIILTSMEYESKTAMRKAYANHLAEFVEYLGITVLKHFKKFLSVVFAYMEVYDGKDEQTRIRILHTLKTAMLHIWIRIPSHADTILKALLKLIIDVSLSSDSSYSQGQQTLLESAVDCMIILRRCCGKEIQESLEAMDAIDNPKFQECIRAARQASDI